MGDFRGTHGGLCLPCPTTFPHISQVLKGLRLSGQRGKVSQCANAVPSCPSTMSQAACYSLMKSDFCCINVTSKSSEISIRICPKRIHQAGVFRHQCLKAPLPFLPVFMYSVLTVFNTSCKLHLSQTSAQAFPLEAVEVNAYVCVYIYIYRGDLCNLG